MPWLCGNLPVMMDARVGEQKGVEIRNYMVIYHLVEDLEKALDFISAAGPAEVVIAGATGGRIDFTLGNLAVFWNYTRGIDAGEVIYALNYNILDQNNDGVVNAADAAILYPQGHGDAYGHYLTALSGYYSLLMNPNFDWVPRVEAVTVLGAAVSVDYQDERKFAAAAAALARTGRQVFDLEWRQDYQPGTSAGWGCTAAAARNAKFLLSRLRSACRWTWKRSLPPGRGRAAYTRSLRK